MPLKPAGNLSQLSSLNVSHSLRPYCKESRKEERKGWRNRGLGGLLRQLSSISTVSHSHWDVRVRETSTQAHCWPLYSMYMLGHTARLRALHGQLDKGGRTCLATMEYWNDQNVHNDIYIYISAREDTLTRNKVPNVPLFYHVFVHLSLRTNTMEYL